MSKIKKYTIDEDIPKNVKASDLLETIGEFVSDGSIEGRERKMFFYFLVEEEEPTFTEAMRTAVIHNWKPSDCKCDDCKI